jgi:hypothetical protein
VSDFGDASLAVAPVQCHGDKLIPSSGWQEAWSKTPPESCRPQ